MKERDFYSESEIYLQELAARFQDQPEKLSSFYRVMEDIRALREEFSGRLENVPDHVLARVKAILEGHCDLIRGFNVFLPPSHRFSVVDDEDDDGESAEVEEEDKKEDAAALAGKIKLLPGFEDAHDLTKKLRMRGEKVWEDLAKILRQAKGRSDLFRFIVPLCEDDADLLECFYRVMRASEAPSPVASHAPDSQDKDVKNRGAVIIKADEGQKKQQPEKNEVAQENDKERNFVRGLAVKPGNHVVEKLLQDGFCLFENFRKKLSREISYYTLLKLFFYYTNGRIGKSEWEESIVAMIGKHSDLMDEFQRYVTVCENVQAFRSKVEEEDEMQRIETKGSKERDRKREKFLYKSTRLDLSQCKKCTPSYIYLPKDYRVPSKHNRMKPELQVLNDRCFSVPSGSENFSTRKIDENEQIMFECEDNRYEMDMLIGWFSSAVDYAEELEKGINDNEMEKGNRNIFVRCLERLYGDQGLEVLHLLNEDPQHALPLLEVRLEQKLKELKDYKDELGKIWADVYARKKLV